MKALFDNFLKLNKNKAYPYNETLLFYQASVILYPLEFEKFYNDKIKDQFKLRQKMTERVLKDSSFTIFPELGLIKIENKNGEKNNYELVNLFNSIEKKHDNLMDYYLEIGFWLDKLNFEIYQLSQCCLSISKK